MDEKKEASLFWDIQNGTRISKESLSSGGNRSQTREERIELIDNHLKSGENCGIVKPKEQYKFPEPKQGRF